MIKKVFILCAVIFVLRPVSLWAFTCAVLPDESGGSIFWAKRTIPFTLDERGTEDIPGTEELDTLRASFAVWNNVPCSDFTFVESGESYNGKIGFDYFDPLNNQNSVTFYEKDWPYSSLALAVTTLVINKHTGEIFDADIEFNSEYTTFSNSDLVIKTDLMNTAVHEIGHIVGLDHVHYSNSVMFPYAASGETRCRTLFPDDEEAICFKYPVGEPNGFCQNAADCPSNCLAPSPPRADEEVKLTITAADESGCNAQGEPAFLALFCLLIGLLKRAVKQNYCS